MEKPAPCRGCFRNAAMCTSHFRESKELTVLPERNLRKCWDAVRCGKTHARLPAVCKIQDFHFTVSFWKTQATFRPAHFQASLHVLFIRAVSSFGSWRQALLGPADPQDVLTGVSTLHGLDWLDAGCLFVCTLQAVEMKGPRTSFRF